MAFYKNELFPQAVKGEYCKVLSRWELENYLLVPELLSEAISDDSATKPDIGEAECIDLLLELGYRLIPIMANMVSTQKHKSLKPITKTV